MSKETTNISKLKKGAPFVWGEIISIHEIDLYTIAAFHPHKSKGTRVYSEIDTGTVQFYVWVDGEETCHSFDSLDAAIVGAIAYRKEGPNHKADMYFMRMVDQPGKDKPCH